MTWAKRTRAALIVTLLAAAPLATASPAAATEIQVSPGETIQHAIDRARAGGTVRVRPGKFYEDLWIHKDGIHLIGAGAGQTHLIARSDRIHYCDNNASSDNGVCVANPPDANSHPSQIVHRVQISGFSIEGFPGFGVVLFGTQDAQVDHTRVTSPGTSGGIASFVSTGTRILDNTTTGSNQSRNGNGPDEAGIIVGDSPHAHAIIEGNHSYANNYGITVRDSSSGRVFDNTVDGNCDGILVLASPFGSGVAAGWTVTDNRSTRNDIACPSDSGMPPVSGVGISLLGATNTRVAGNDVRRNRPSGPSARPGGITVTASTTGPSQDDLIDDNTSFGNQPDLAWDLQGTHIRFTDNECRTSQPAGMCGSN